MFPLKNLARKGLTPDIWFVSTAQYSGFCQTKVSPTCPMNNFQNKGSKWDHNESIHFIRLAVNPL